MTPPDTTHIAELDLDPNEASGLLRVRDPALLQDFGWDVAFWSVLDEVDVADCVVLVGHRDGEPIDTGWSAERLKAERHGSGGPAKDAEAVTYWAGHVYVVGSHHGGKEGPIRREEQWLARFDEAAVVADESAGTPGASLTVVNTGFRLHRMLNVALLDCALDLAPMADRTRRSFITATMDGLRGTPAEGLVRADDWTVNIEGADVTDDGDLLLGLRFPVHADGRPIVLQVARSWCAAPRCWRDATETSTAAGAPRVGTPATVACLPRALAILE